jgi:hypothetical protein
MAGSCGGFATDGGGMSPVRRRCNTFSHAARCPVIDAADIMPVTSRPPDASRSLWQPAHVLFSTGTTMLSNSSAGLAAGA